MEGAKKFEPFLALEITSLFPFMVLYVSLKWRFPQSKDYDRYGYSPSAFMKQYMERMSTYTRLAFTYRMEKVIRSKNCKSRAQCLQREPLPTSSGYPGVKKPKRTASKGGLVGCPLLFIDTWWKVS